LGTASNTTVNSGGVQLVGFMAIGTVVKSGGIQYDFGTASNTTLSGEQDVFGTASGTIVKNGGIEYVEDGGKAIGTIIHNGGQEIVESGGIANGATISGGMLEFKSGATAGSNAITFAGSGTLTLDASIDFGGLVAGFAKPDRIDLKDISFVSGTTWETFTEAASLTSGTLTVSDGMHAANITLLGQYVTANFLLASDGHGGTLVTEHTFATPWHHGFLDA
jgi:autotransporter passenger strand-loop-strand repeat protein